MLSADGVGEHVAAIRADGEEFKGKAVHHRGQEHLEAVPPLLGLFPVRQRAARELAAAPGVTRLASRRRSRLQQRNPSS